MKQVELIVMPALFNLGPAFVTVGIYFGLTIPKTVPENQYMMTIISMAFVIVGAVMIRNALGIMFSDLIHLHRLLEAKKAAYEPSDVRANEM